MNPLSISVIGGGYWGKKVVREILDIGRTTREVELKSLVDTSPASLAACREEFGDSIEYGWDYQSLATDPSLSGVTSQPQTALTSKSPQLSSDKARMCLWRSR